ncbi:LmeA family phospholipid-binding protein [Dietzia cercidiphylli]|uniref:LmeA family phospholipid-binding protein n=1 Tax=Dietzia cercidiphylli TaxID=498199 RepID=UPI003F81260F
MRRRDPIDRRGRRDRRRGGCGCSLLVLLLLVLGLAVAAEFGARWYLADRAEREASARLGAPVSVGFGPTPILWDLATTRAVDTVRMTSPGDAGVPRIDVTGYSVRMVDGAILAASADGTATLSGDQLAAAAAEGNPAGDSPVAGLTEVRSVRPDAQAGLLRADIGGIAEIGVAPGVSGGRLTLTPEQTELIGIPLPDGLFSGITGTVDSTVAALPEGVSIHGARVVPDGLEVALIGTDVTLR